MAGIMENASQIVLVLLLIMWAALLFGGFVFPRAGADATRRMPVWTRMASSLTLVVAAWLWYVSGRDTSSAPLHLLVAGGMTLGLLGDLFMARLMPVNNHVLGGISAFGLGHVLYIASMVWYGNFTGLDADGPRWGALVVWLLVGATGWYVMAFRGQSATALHYAALPYALLLAGTAGIATGLALQNALFVWMAAGAALFLISDLILAGELFSGLHFRLIGDVVWLTYGPAQMLLVYGAGSVLGLM